MCGSLFGKNSLWAHPFGRKSRDVKAPEKLAEVPSGHNPLLRGGIMPRKSHVRNKLRSKILCRPTSVGGFTVEMQISENEVYTHPQEIAI